MSHFASPKTAQIWAERIAQCERSNASVAQFCQSIGCSPTSFYQWKRKLAAKPQATAFLRVQTSDSTKNSIEIKLPSGISIMVPVSAVESIAAILEQVEKRGDCPRVFCIVYNKPNQDHLSERQKTEALGSPRA